MSKYDSKRSWAPEPWKIRLVGTIGADIVDVNSDFMIADAARIVACVNAMQGITDPLEWIKTEHELRCNHRLNELTTEEFQLQEAITRYAMAQELISFIDGMLDLEQFNSSAMRDWLEAEMWSCVEIRKNLV